VSITDDSAPPHRSELENLSGFHLTAGQKSSRAESAICVVCQPWVALSSVTRRYDRGLLSRQAIFRDDCVLRS
jgi:hypothetical protein